MKTIDMTGWDMKEHGFPNSRLKVIQRDFSKNSKKVYWLCQCECGNIKSIQGTHLREGTLSCGCLQKEIFSSITKKDLVGQKFGKLTIVKDSGKRTKQGNIIWICNCECGNKCEISSHELLNDDTHSCGCLETSYGELVLEKILKDNKVTFIKEKTFPDLLSPKGFPLRYDFYLNDKNILIEFDGKQHFDKNNFFNYNNYEYRHECDVIKNNYAINNSIKLYRIPYTDIKKINIDNLFNKKYEVI